MSAETIARAFGLRRAGREYAGKCPSCGYKTGFAVADRKGGLPLVYCHAGGCLQQDLIDALRKVGLWPDERDRETPYKRNRPKAKMRAPAQASPEADDPSPDPRTKAAFAIWRRAQSAAGTAAETYLRCRGYAGPIPPALRFAAGKHPSDPDHYYPMMVGAVVRDDRLVAIHRTFLRADGTGKADLDPAKLTLGTCKGASVPLAPAGPILAIAEGIETALSFMQATGIPIWSALSAGGIRSLILPPSVREVIIAADNDPTGLAKAHAAARRWTTYGRKVRVVVPPTGRGDFNDMARTVS